MAVSNIAYSNKVALDENQSVADINKVKADDMNEIKTVVNNNAIETSTNATNIENLQNGNVYSANEVDTAKTWIDGKPIYRKVVEFGSFPNSGSKTVATGITNLARIISLKYTWYDSSDGAYFTNVRVDSATVMCKIQFKVNNNSLNVEGTGIDWSSRTSQGVAIIEYTKTTN